MLAWVAGIWTGLLWAWSLRVAYVHGFNSCKRAFVEEMKQARGAEGEQL